MRTITAVEPKAALVVAGQFKFEALDVSLQEKIKSFETDLREAMHLFTDATLKIGQALSGIQKILEPRGAFTAYLKTLPGFSKATAYRYIEKYETLQKALPGPILERVIAAGIPMTSTDEKQPFGKYTKTMKKLALPKGPLSEEKADAWVAELQAKTPAAPRQTKNMSELAKEAIRYVLGHFNKVPETDRLAWLRDVLTEVGNNVGLDIAVSLKTETKIAQAAHNLETTFGTARSARSTSPRAHA